MKKVLFFALFAVSLIALAPPAFADVCNFQGSTLGFSRWSDFDANRPQNASCTNGANPTFAWNCTNPNAVYAGANITHKFATNAGGSCALTCTCAGNPQTTTTLTRFVCFAFGVPGCILPDRGYN